MKTGKQKFCNPHSDLDVDRFKAKIDGCCDAQIDIDFMKRIIDSLLRLDLEQAAAVVISAIRNDDAIAKIKNHAVAHQGDRPKSPHS